jgi:hypothetical protein
LRARWSLARAQDEYVVHDDAVPDSFTFDPAQRCGTAAARAENSLRVLTRALPPAARVKLKVSKDKLEKAARRAKRDFVCASPCARADCIFPPCASAACVRDASTHAALHAPQPAAYVLRRTRPGRAEPSSGC